MKRIREQADEDLDRLRALLTAWHDRFGTSPVTVAAAIRQAGDSGELHNALTAFCRSGKPEAKPIGNALRKAQGRIAGGFVFRRDADRTNGVALWDGEHTVEHTP